MFFKLTGRDGQAGLDSQPGNLVISVVNTTTGDVDEYTSLYKFELTTIAPFYSTTGIIEPGQRVEVTRFVVANKGGNFITVLTYMYSSLEYTRSCW